jgi:Cd2+/Zn2+-exporting ATPase
MVREYVLQGLDCPHCANKIETAVRRADNVAQATVNFLTATLRVELAPSYKGNFLPDVEKIVRKYEPGIAVKTKNQGEHENHTGHENEVSIFGHSGNTRNCRLYLFVR